MLVCEVEEPLLDIKRAVAEDEEANEGLPPLLTFDAPRFRSSFEEDDVELKRNELAFISIFDEEVLMVGWIKEDELEEGELLEAALFRFDLVKCTRISRQTRTICETM